MHCCFKLGNSIEHPTHRILHDNPLQEKGPLRSSQRSSDSDHGVRDLILKKNPSCMRNVSTCYPAYSMWKTNMHRPMPDNAQLHLLKGCRSIHHQSGGSLITSFMFMDSNSHKDFHPAISAAPDKLGPGDQSNVMGASLLCNYGVLGHLSRSSYFFESEKNSVVLAFDGHLPASSTLCRKARVLAHISSGESSRISSCRNHPLPPWW